MSQLPGKCPEKRGREVEMALGGPAGGPQPTAARASHVDTPRAQGSWLSQEARLTPTVAASGLEGLTPVGSLLTGWGRRGGQEM